ncbi:hypothetical protein HDR63_04335 [bacterium]|nr:hypothetical protein [bacterium]
MPNPNVGLNPALGLTLDNGEICINSMQCTSKVCLHDTILGIARCAPKATAGEECTLSAVYGVYYKPVCDRGLSCVSWTTELENKYPEFSSTSDGYGRCIDVGDVCDICDFKTSWTAASTGYVTRKVGSCGSATNCALSIVQYRCAAGYYGIDPVGGSSSATGCTVCPANATCPAGNNLTFQCVAGYFRSGSGCAPCPTEQGLTGTSAANATAIDACYIPDGTYTDAGGTFEIAERCPYTL